MRERYGKFHADWRDEKGIRHMKACRSRKAALRLTAKMRVEVTGKNSHASARSPKRSTVGPRRTATRKTRTPTSAPPKTSGKSSAISATAN